jgi:CRP/FNR family transcriptional regulator
LVHAKRDVVIDRHGGLTSTSRESSLAEILRRASLFEGLDDSHLQELISRSRRRLLAGRQTLFLQGDRAQGTYVVVSGRVKVFKLSPKGREQTLMIMGPGEPVGEVAVLSGEAYPPARRRWSRVRLSTCPGRRSWTW